jgi:hypothetical protein
MSIDPKILARRAACNSLLNGPLATDLTGTDKQVKWAAYIRDEALALTWPPEVEAKLRKINDSTWWIANKTIATTMKFKEPAPHQLVGGPPPPPKGRETQPELAPQTSPTLAADVFTSCIGFAASVSRNPKQAEATILALLAKLYKPPMRDKLQAESRRIKVEAEFEVGRDLDAINKLLG